ncbi:MAG: glycosyltransferase family 2 protein [Bacteroidales bacterium]|nr:glycosyltransferase family 2 protein [Bacteroidales bacterium]
MRITAIICAYNEQDTIKNVATAALDYFFDEVIIVNDGSTDKTEEILKEISKFYDFKYIALPENKGKGFAMATGIENTKSEIILFIDADLLNLKDEHFWHLLIPVIENEADMVLGQATETLINYKYNPFKSFSGQRVFLKKDVLPILDEMKHSRFGVETLINLYYQSEGKRIKYVMLEELKHPSKFDKTNTSQAIIEFMKEGHQIAQTVFQNYELITKTIKNTISKNI